MMRLDKVAADDAPAVKKIVRKALRAGCKPVLASARANAPVLRVGTKNREPGLLGKSIKIRAGRSGKGRIGMKVGTGKNNNPAFYLNAIRKGANNRTTILGCNRGSIAPNKFMDEALATNTGTAIEIIRENLASGIEKQMAP